MKPCIACNGALRPESRTIRVIGRDVVFQPCRECGSWVQTQGLSDEELRDLFNSAEYFGSPDNPGFAYRNYLADEKARQAEAAERCRSDFAPFLQKDRLRILEVGCASGTVLAALKERGHEVQGLDWSQMMATAARKFHDIDVKVSNILDASFPPASFDLLLMLGTISNFRMPVESFSRIRDWMAPGAHLLVTATVCDSLPMRVMPRLGRWMLVPSIAAFYSEAGIRRILERAGLRMVLYRQDYQRPSWAKLATHARMPGLARFADQRGFGNRPIPLRLPMPSVRFMAMVSST